MVGGEEERGEGEMLLGGKEGEGEGEEMLARRAALRGMVPALLDHWS